MWEALCNFLRKISPLLFSFKVPAKIKDMLVPFIWISFVVFTKLDADYLIGSAQSDSGECNRATERHY